MSRRTLPSRRRSFTQFARISGNGVYITVGLYPDGSPGDVFITLSKEGASLRYWAENAALLFSMSMQCGTGLDTLIKTFRGTKSQPCGAVTGYDRITHCTSILDLVVRLLGIEFLGREDLADAPAGVPEDAEPEYVAGPVHTGKGW